MNEKDKFYRALRILIYFVIGYFLFGLIVAIIMLLVMSGQF